MLDLNNFDEYSILTCNIMENFREQTLDLIISELKLSFKKENYFRSCLILLMFSDQEIIQNLDIQRFIDEGILEFLLNLYESEIFPFKYLIFQFLSRIKETLMSLVKVDELKIILRASVKYSKSHPACLMLIIEIIEFISNENEHFHDIDFTHLFELNLENYDPFFFHNASVLIQNQQGVDPNFIKKTIEKSLNLLSSNHEVDFRYKNEIEKILIFMKNEYKPFMSETIKICAIRLNECLNEPEKQMPHYLAVLKYLVQYFRDECELYISKYKLVDLVIQIMKKFRRDDSFEKEIRRNSIRFLVVISSYKSESLKKQLDKILSQKILLYGVETM
jgi:hypothetical protein